MDNIYVQDNAEEMLGSLPQLQQEILALKMRGWCDSDIVRKVESPGSTINSVEDIREQIDPLFVQLLREMGQAIDTIDLLYNSKPPLSNTEIEMGICSMPALIISGDFCDIINMDQGRIGIALGDGKGHGLKACILASSVHAHLHSYAASAIRPAKTLKDINHAMSLYCSPSEFVTLFYGILDLDSKNLLFSHAAHPYIMHYIYDTGAMVGPRNIASNWIPWPEDAEYFDESIHLGKGDIVVAWTDGITETPNTGNAILGQSGLQSAIEQHTDLPAQALAKRIYETAKEYSGASSLRDDATVIALKRRFD